MAEATQPAETLAPVETATAEPEAPGVAASVDGSLKAEFGLVSYQDARGGNAGTSLDWPCFIGEVPDAGDGKVLVWFAQNPVDPQQVALTILKLSCPFEPNLQGVIVADLNQVPLAEVTRADGIGVC
ncbi:hypothetical protein [Pseudoclavibacter sp. AY1H1]|uniref:hypothetical protein n=1 Tax=Pseudoclavibacter sp. AY1H1 TaxID=2080584 RepID=UPI000CE859E1|nr:hypothetical protein [Pseudoclavibacter sp. AY1H1]PPF39811.1 hypothetical protein C5E05_00925 [Pseudoclavibacter sp. AY1H1]